MSWSSILVSNYTYWQTIHRLCGKRSNMAKDLKAFQCGDIENLLGAENEILTKWRE